MANSTTANLISRIADVESQGRLKRNAPSMWEKLWGTTPNSSLFKAGRFKLPESDGQNSSFGRFEGAHKKTHFLRLDYSKCARMGKDEQPKQELFEKLFKLLIEYWDLPAPTEEDDWIVVEAITKANLPPETNKVVIGVADWKKVDLWYRGSFHFATMSAKDLQKPLEFDFTYTQKGRERFPTLRDDLDCLLMINIGQELSSNGSVQDFSSSFKQLLNSRASEFSKRQLGSVERRRKAYYFIQKHFRLPAVKGGKNNSYGFLSAHLNGWQEKYSQMFLRIDGRHLEKSYMEYVYELVAGSWQLGHPDITIELMGSADPLDKDSWMNIYSAFKSFFESLKKDNAINGKHVWIISSGVNCGMSRLAAEAFRNVEPSRVRFLAIANWHVLSDAQKKKMENTEGGSYFYSDYKEFNENGAHSDYVNSEQRHHLNLGQSAFLLVDTGEEGYGKEVQFRSEFISYIWHRRQKQNPGNPIQRVFLLLGGGLINLQRVEQAVRLNLAEREAVPTRVLVFKHSGRVSDAIAWAVEKHEQKPSLTVDDIKEMSAAEEKNLAKTIVGENIELKNQNHVYELLHSIAMRRHMITTLDIVRDKLQEELINVFSQFKGKKFNTWTESYYSNNFDYYICYDFVPKEPSSQLCKCNLPKSAHGTKPSNAEDTTSMVRSHDLALVNTRYCKGGRRCGNKRCDCDTIKCGTLRFVAPEATLDPSGALVSTCYARFARLFVADNHVASDEYFKKVYLLLTEFWKVRKPQLLIGVTGTAEDLRGVVPPHVIKKFKQELIQAARAAKAWLIAGGSNLGALKLVGDAVYEHRITHGGSGIPCIAVATWGKIEYRYDIFNRNIQGTKDQSIGRNVVTYEHRNDQDYSAKLERGDFFQLNPGYDHWLLIDRGIDDRYGEEITFRTNLVEFLSRQTPYKSRMKESFRQNETPLVQIVVGGGPNTLLQAAEALGWSRNEEKRLRPRPLILMKGFGGCADFLSLIYFALLDQSYGSDEEWKVIRQHSFIVNLLKIAKNKQEVASQIALIFSEPAFVTVVDVSDKQTQDKRNHLEHAIFEGVFKQEMRAEPLYVKNTRQEEHFLKWLREEFQWEPAQATKKAAPAELSTSEQLKSFELSLLWNRPDFASKIMKSQTAIVRLPENQQVLEEAMMEAVVHNNETMFSLLIETDLANANEFFTGHRMGLILYRLFFHPSSWKVEKGITSQDHKILFKRLLGTDVSTITFRFRSHSSNITKDKFEAKKKEIDKMFQHQLGFTWWDKPVTLVAKEEPKLDASIKNLILLLLFLGRDEFALAAWKKALGSSHLKTAVMASIFLSKLAKMADKDLQSQYNEMARKWEIRSMEVVRHLADHQQTILQEILTSGTRDEHFWPSQNILGLAYEGTRKTFLAESAIQEEFDTMWTLPTSFQARRMRCSKQNKTAPGGAASASNHSGLFGLMGLFGPSPRSKFFTYCLFLMIFLTLFLYDLVHVSHHPIACFPKPGFQLRLAICIMGFLYLLDSGHDIYITKGINMSLVVSTLASVFLLVANFLNFAVCYSDVDAFTTFQLANAYKFFYALSFIFFWVKCFELFMIHKDLGLKVWTLYEMMIDVGFFLLLFILAMAAFAAPIYFLRTDLQGVGDLSKDHHNSTSDHWPFNEQVALVFRIFYERWWDIVGIHIDESKQLTVGPQCQNVMIFQEDEPTELNTAKYFRHSNDGPEIGCNYNNVAASLLFLVFIFFTNIILINLLTATFAVTVDRVRARAEEQWKYDRYRLIRSFSVKPLSPPINIFEYIFIWPFFRLSTGMDVKSVPKVKPLDLEEDSLEKLNEKELRRNRAKELDLIVKAAAQHVNI